VPGWHVTPLFFSGWPPGPGVSFLSSEAAARVGFQTALFFFVKLSTLFLTKNFFPPPPGPAGGALFFLGRSGVSFMAVWFFFLTGRAGLLSYSSVVVVFVLSGQQLFFTPPIRQDGFFPQQHGTRCSPAGPFVLFFFFVGPEDAGRALFFFFFPYGQGRPFRRNPLHLD